ncbi:acyl-protein thioesterase 1 [Exophiala viscosa]|uniref:acyl-protein thioesterase 1 n=1 Tax=Exophiala viscosa TaxID=2486360 RepID=UPI00219C48FF|nr:acyl-protein thioesterase 1 [Exophiala viscosa]
MAGRQALIVPALKKHSATIIMAHGLGDSGAGWVSLAESWRRRGKFEDVKFIFPNAPNIPITVNFGMSMPGWYDISDFSDLNQQQDESGIFRSRSTFTKLITDEVAAGIPSNRIILGGFSQGGAMSLFTGVTTPHKLGGVFGLSCYLVLADKIKELAKEASDANKDTAFFMGHGDADEVVKYRWGQRTAEMLKNELGHKVEFKTYKGLPHSADMQEIDDLEEFIKRCLPSYEYL